MSLSENIVIAEFAVTTSDFGKVIMRANTRFGTDFRRIASGDLEAATQTIFTTGGMHLSPTKERNSIKRELSGLLASSVLASERLQAARVYERVRRAAYVGP